MHAEDGPAQPAWLELAGEERLEREYSALRRDLKAGKLPGVTKVFLQDEDLRTMRIKVEWLDGRTQAGMQFIAELERIKREHGPGHASLQLEVSFGEAYPAEPFLLRVVRPRVKPFTVHLTEGGSVCLEALTLSAGKGGWNPGRTVGGILRQLLQDFVLPHGSSKEGAPDNGGGATCNDAPGYSLQGAQDTFQRAAWQNGWTPTPPPLAVLAAAAAAAADARLALLPALPPHWEVSDALLAGETVFVELPLPWQPGPPPSPGQRAALQEAEQVLQHFYAQPPPNARVVCIERVQSLELWHRYHRRRELVQRESGLPDVQLFHGTSKESLEVICRSGFDVRLANSRGSLGADLYFGTCSGTSANYCGKVFDRAAVRALGHRPAELDPSDTAPPGASPLFQPGGYAMLLCRVVQGRAGTGSRGVRAPQPGYHSAVTLDVLHAVYLSDQAYPEYVIHFASSLQAGLL
ncbi:hypothetical protein ABPG75_000248 [Micractinium tetrahymenae]